MRRQNTDHQDGPYIALIRRFTRLRSRLTATTLAVCIILTGVGTGANYYKSVQVLSAAELQSTPLLAPFKRSDRVLIVSPHPDDETLACAGVIQAAKDAGAEVRVVFVTNGDGFRLALQRYWGVVKPRGQHYIRFGQLRQQEALHALKALKLRDDDVICLGYPDRGISALWSRNWTPAQPYRSHYTNVQVNPYRDAPGQGLTYCGQNLLHDLESQLTQFQPTHVFTSSTCDDHPDHVAVGQFVQAAVARLYFMGTPFAQHVELYAFLVHDGAWPRPQGFFPDAVLSPPECYTPPDFRWVHFPMSDRQVEAKREAVERYASQTRMLGRYMRSFVRTNELFYPVNFRSQLAGDWACMNEPVEENMVTQVQSGADIRELEIHRTHKTLTLTLRMRKPAPPGVRVDAIVRVLDLSEYPRDVVFRLSTETGVPRLRQIRSADSVSLNCAAPEPGELFMVQASTRFAGLPVDRFNSRIFR